MVKVWLWIAAEGVRVVEEFMDEGIYVDEEIEVEKLLELEEICPPYKFEIILLRLVDDSPTGGLYPCGRMIINGVCDYG